MFRYRFGTNDRIVVGKCLIEFKCRTEWTTMADHASVVHLDLPTSAFDRRFSLVACLFLSLSSMQSGFSQDEMFEYFNCGVDYLLIIDHSKATVENVLEQLTGTHTSSFYLGNFFAISQYSSPSSLCIQRCSLQIRVQLENLFDCLNKHRSSLHHGHEPFN